MEMKYGKYRGMNITDIPDEGYIAWLINGKREELAELEAELRRRQFATLPIAQKIVEAGYRTLAKQNGTSVELDASVDELRRIVSALGEARVKAKGGG